MNTITITKESFQHWLRQQPRSREFKYSDIYNCPIASFFREMLNMEVVVGGFYYHLAGESSQSHEIPKWLDAGIEKARHEFGYSGIISVKALRRVFLPWRERVFGLTGISSARGRA